MKPEALRQHLISDRTRLFCVLDGASVPELPRKLYDMGPANFCLFGDDLDAEMLYVAPFLVHLAPDSKFTDLVLTQGFGNHWGVFLHSRYSITEMRGHFSALLNVYDEDGQPMKFRYYDPRVLTRFLPTCNAGELKTFFGKVDTFFAENDGGKGLLSFRLDNDNLKTTELE
jgi:hypothetical protein